MKSASIRRLFLSGCTAAGLLLASRAVAADHNDPNAVNSIFSDVEVNAADLYDMFGWPSDDATGGEKAIIALTFAAVPKAGVFDNDMLYRVLIAPGSRITARYGDETLPGLLAYFHDVKDKYVKLRPSEVRVTVGKDNRANIAFNGFPGGSFSKVIDLNQTVNLPTPDGQIIKAYLGGRDDAFFNDLPGFFRSINYAPQFYHVPLAKADTRELPIPKTLLELEGNKLFNFDPANPLQGQGVKLDLPAGPLTWSGDKFHKDANGNYRFVYSGKDAQAGKNINAIILEIPLTYLTKNPQQDRIVNTWGESWVLKASAKVASIPNDRAPVAGPFYLAHPWVLPGVAIALGGLLMALGILSARPPAAPGKSWKKFAFITAGIILETVGLAAGIILTMIGGQRSDLSLTAAQMDEELRKYKLVDTDGQPFADAALNQRENDKQLGAYNFALGPDFVVRLAHLGWGFGPSIKALGLRTSFDCGDAPVSVHKTYSNALEAFPRAKKVVFQRLNMPDNSWNKKGLDIPLKRSLEVFIPNVCPIDMDTTGTWPYGRRLEDQVATRFLALFLDMDQEVAGKRCNLETLSDQALWDHAPIEPKTPPNPLKNDKEFLKEFPYLAAPWEEASNNYPAASPPGGAGASAARP